MFNNQITCGHVISVSKPCLVKEAFQSKAGVAGVVFPLPLDLPFPTSRQIKPLSKDISLQFFYPHGFIRNDNEIYKNFKGDRRWVEGYVNAGYELLELADSFNRSSSYRECKYLVDNALNEPAHIDEAASELFLHAHIRGQGMEIYMPTGDGVVMLNFDKDKKYSEEFASPKMLTEFLNDKKLRTFRLKEGEGIAFNDTLLHASGAGPRFRCFVS